LPSELHVVTGAFGYTGRYVARRLLDEGKHVRTITGRPDRPSPFGDAVEARPFDFDRPERLVESLRGAAVLYNTYWVRFDRGEATYERAVENTRTLIEAARTAGVGRLVHVSITSPSEESELPYFRGKAILEREIRESGLPHAIVRPTVVFGREDILVNNIAWLLRRSPLFAVPGDGRYPVQPVYVDDLAGLLVDAGRRRENENFDAVGPETFAFEDLVRAIGRALGRRVTIVHLPSEAVYAVSRALGLALRDVLLTREEIAGLMQGLLVSQDEPSAPTRLTDWLAEAAPDLGRRYASEVARHYARPGGRAVRNRIPSA
jgi:NADH dehydrogenase